MIKETIRFEDLDGNMVQEDFYFNLTKSELVEADLGQNGDLRHYLNSIVRSNDRMLIFRTFKKIIAMCVGKRSSDGRRFLKSAEITAEFMETNACDEFIFSLMSDAKRASEFIRGVMPKDLAAKIDENGDLRKAVDSVPVKSAMQKDAEEIRRFEAEYSTRDAIQLKAEVDEIVASDADSHPLVVHSIFDDITRPVKEELTSDPNDIKNYSPEELLEMPQDLFDELAGTDAKKMHPEVLKIAYRRRAARRSI